jgi:hypothetical protein
MKKIRLSAIVIMFCLSCIIFAACSDKSSDAGKNSSVSSGQKEKYIEKAQNVITLFNEEKSDEIVELCDEAMKNALPKEKLSEVYTQIKSNGDFEKFLEGEMTKVEQGGKTFTVVVQQAKYEKNTLTYTISFDNEDKLAGIFYK